MCSFGRLKLIRVRLGGGPLADQRRDMLLDLGSRVPPGADGVRHHAKEPEPADLGDIAGPLGQLEDAAGDDEDDEDDAEHARDGFAPRPAGRVEDQGRVPGFLHRGECTR